MRHCHENDSKNADQSPGGGYTQEDVPRGKNIYIYLNEWTVTIYTQYTLYINMS